MADVTAPVAPLGPPTLSMGGAAIQMAVALVLILVVILLAYWILKRFGPRMGIGRSSNKGMSLRVEGHLALGPRKNIMVVRFLNKVLVLGVTDQSINLLTEADVPDEQTDFQAVLDDAGRGAGDPGPAGPGGRG